MKADNGERDTSPVIIRKKTGDIFCYGKTQTDPDVTVVYGNNESGCSFVSNTDSSLCLNPENNTVSSCCEVGCRILAVYI